jgi:hypothetical protein
MKIEEYIFEPRGASGYQKVREWHGRSLPSQFSWGKSEFSIIISLHFLSPA